MTWFWPKRLTLAAAGSALLIAGLDTAADAGCAELPLQGEGLVTEIVDARTFRMADGGQIRLAGIEPASERRSDGVAALATLVRGRRIAVRAADETPDRYGRQTGVVFMDTEAMPVQTRLLGSGDALVGLGISDPACRKELLAAEASARRAKLGIWAGGATKIAANSVDILPRIGRFTVVEGDVASVREVGGSVYLNFGRDWTKVFAVIISRRIVGLFEAAGVAPKSLKGRRIRVRGWVEKRAGPVIPVRDVGQIEPLGDGERP